MAKKPIDEIVSIEEKRNRRAELLQVSTAIFNGFMIANSKNVYPANYEACAFDCVAIAKKLIDEVDKNV